MEDSDSKILQSVRLPESNNLLKMAQWCRVDLLVIIPIVKSEYSFNSFSDSCVSVQPCQLFILSDQVTMLAIQLPSSFQLYIIDSHRKTWSVYFIVTNYV